METAESISEPCDVISEGDDWLTECYWVLRQEIDGFLHHYKAATEQDINKILASFSTC